MTDTPQGSTQEDSRETTQAERSVWSLSRDEQRMLLITFAGGLGSIIAGVLFVGAALAVIRVAGNGIAPLIGVLAFVTFGQLVTMYVVVVTRSRSGVWGVFLGLMYCLLLWVGLAAGVK